MSKQAVSNVSNPAVLSSDLVDRLRARGRRDDVVMRPDPDDEPVMPAQTKDETGIGWGEDPEPDDDERLRRERPPHWDQ